MRQVRQHLEKTLRGRGVSAAIVVLRHLYGMTGTEIAWSLDRDRTMVSLYANGQVAMPEKVRDRLVELLRDCLTVAKSVQTRQDGEEELLEALIARTEEVIGSL